MIDKLEKLRRDFTTDRSQHEWNVSALERWAQGFTLESWQEVVFENSWVNIATTYTDAAYWKDPFGIVHLRGLVKDGVVGSTIFTLPVGYRPTGTKVYMQSNAGTAEEVYVNADGTVVLPAGVNTSLSLDGVTFRAAST